MCDIAHALLVERVEGDARAEHVGAGVAAVLGADGVEEFTPEHARTRLEDKLAADADEASSGSGRPAGITDDEWELRTALGVGLREAG